VSEANFTRADSLRRRQAKPATPVDTLFFDVAEAFYKDDAVAKTRTTAALEEALKKEKKPRWAIYRNLAFAVLDAGNIDGAEQLHNHRIDPKTPVDIQRGYASTDALFKMLRGRYREAVAMMPSTREPDSKNVDPDLAMEPFFTPSKEKLEELRAGVARYDSTAGSGDDPEDVLRPQFRLYWLAMLNCRLGNTTEALSQAQKLEALPAPTYWKPAMQAMATDVRAFADVARGDVKQALDRIESIPIDVPLDLVDTDARRQEETLWRGELLYRNGRYDEALAYFENPSSYNSEAWPFFYLRAAEIYDRKGNSKKAASLYAKFLNFWKNPDPELQPLVQEARNALAALQRKVD
jgi:tetratricopeptide (TPR) repeat protein